MTKPTTNKKKKTILIQPI